MGAQPKDHRILEWGVVMRSTLHLIIECSRVAGWVSSYYLDGNHRGLEVAKSCNYYVKRVFDEHGLTGRRLYLSVWNLAEVVDATKSIYKAELVDRVERMVQFH